MWVFSANPYRKFYEKMGGKTVGRKNWPFFGLDLEAIAYGWKDISLLKLEKNA